MVIVELVRPVAPPMEVLSLDAPPAPTLPVVPFPVPPVVELLDDVAVVLVVVVPASPTVVVALVDDSFEVPPSGVDVVAASVVAPPVVLVVVVVAVVLVLVLAVVIVVVEFAVKLVTLVSVLESVFDVRSPVFDASTGAGGSSTTVAQLAIKHRGHAARHCTLMPLVLVRCCDVERLIGPNNFTPINTSNMPRAHG